MNVLILIPVVMLWCATGNAQISVQTAHLCTPSVHPPDPNGDCCGITNYYRIPGLFANLGEYPWMGIVEYQKKNKTKLLCSAILISSRYALTAAQCFSAEAARLGTAVSVRLGEHDTSNDGIDCVDIDSGNKECNDGALSIPIEKIIVHPEYNNNRSHQNDIALIRLAKMAPHTDFISPICLPTSDITINSSRSLMMTVAGWGAINSTSPSTNVLHHVTVPFVDFNTCQSAYTARKGPRLGSGQLCAGGKGRDACKGDSGGPLMYKNARTTEVAGIVSFGPVPCGMDGVPGVYTKVFAFDTWIRANIEE